MYNFVKNINIILSTGVTMKHKVVKISVFLLIFIFISILLLKDPFIGIADNTDYYRVIQPLGFETEGYIRYFNAYNFYEIKNMDSTNIKDSIKYIINPDVENNNEYFSTQFIFIKISMIINFLLKVILGKSPEVFNIKILGLLYTIFYAYGLYLFLKNINIKSKVLNVLFIILSIIILCDIGYVIYFNSFFGEAPIIATIMLAAGSCLALIKNEEIKYCIYYGIIFFVSSFILVGAKVANTPIGILIAIFSVSLLLVKKDEITRNIIILGTVILTTFSIFYYVSAPDWMNQVNNYQALFYGILKDSPNPKKDLEKLGISEKYLPLANSHGFLDHGEFDIYSNEFQEEVYDKASFVGILKFYLLNPQRLIDKLILSSDNSVIIRPSYLGNFTIEDNPERISFTERFSIWSNLRTNTLGLAFYIIVIYSIVYFIINIYEIVKASKLNDKFKIVYGFAGMLLFLTTMSQYVLPIIGNGEADLQKHMLLFNICFDLMILIGFVWLFNNYNNKIIFKMIPVVGVLLVLLNIITLGNTSGNPQLNDNIKLKAGDIIQFGTYESQPLKWEVLNYNEEKGYLVWSEKAVEYMEFDLIDEVSSKNIYGSNKWENSDVRKWLNSDFKSSFTQGEQELVNKVQLKNILSYNDISNKAGGDKPYYWSAITSYVDQNYDKDAYYNYSEDEIFLLDSSQLKNNVYDNNINFKKNNSAEEKTRYWLRTPYYSSISMVRMVDKDGLVYHKDANVKAGIIPAMYLNNSISIVNGDGTKDNPYVIKLFD